jgi:hypothetical protein
MMTDDNSDDRLQKLNDVRDVLDWLEAHPQVPLPYDIGYGGFLIASVNLKGELQQLAREFGECEKEFSQDSFYLRKRFGTSSLYAFTARQEVCERVVVGVEQVPEEIRPAYQREIVEWRCNEPLLSVNGGSSERSD